MTCPKQHTVARTVSFGGRGLHTGKPCLVTLAPAPPDSGIIFRRADLNGVRVPATIAHARKLVRCSGLAKGKATVRTCEHLLTALYGCGIHNAVIDLTAEEVPILDGSALLLLHEVDKAGRKEQGAPLAYIRVTKPVESRDGERFVRIEPADALSIDLSLTLRRFGTLDWSGPLDRETFRREIAPARTFAPMRHAIPMKLLSLLTRMPIARGATLDNLLLFARGRVWNPGGQRLDNELARHRVLDVLGDLMLAGGPVLGKITAFRSSHSLNQDMVAALLRDTSAWEKTTCP